ncbi:MAG: ArsR family transcriptional regulator [Pseudomonadota bacterium]
MSGASFFDFTMGHARLAILRALVEAPTHSANDSVLAMLMETLGFPVTRDQLRTQLGWLEEQGLIEVARPTGSLVVARLRERGGDVAVGRSRVDGVQRPAPGR